MDTTVDQPDADRGLSAAEVAERIAAGRVNTAVDPPDRSVGAIVAANVLTPVNAIMLVLFGLIVSAGSWQDGLFVGVVVSNSVVGVTQEVKARRELARLQVLTEPEATVVRDGEIETIESAAVVEDDTVVLAPGGQVPIDGRVLIATGLRLDESMLTGESEPVMKEIGDDVLSGSFVVAGSGRVHASAVGAASYAGHLTTEAQTFSVAESELRQAINQILRWLTFIIPVASILLFLSLLESQDTWQDAMVGTVAAAVAMVPDGLVLLTSVAFVAGVRELSRRRALAKQLSTVEVLARVDVLCLDKTGTITTGDIVFADLHPLAGQDGSEVRTALRALVAADDAPNATMAAIGAETGADSDWVITRVEPFSSARKWSAVQFEDRGWFFLGAPDVLLGSDSDRGQLVADLSAAGQRLVAVGRSEQPPIGDVAPDDLAALAIVELRDEIRPDADEILAYFADQGVTLKVISGDSPATVAAIAERAGLEVGSDPVDARELPETDDALGEALTESTVFGRVAPTQKQAMVHALQQRGHVVAMTGDGVNDVLALKDANLGIAMGSGSAASRSVADLVLVDDAFATLPVVVDEGRKVINNVERVANLFVTKAAYAVLFTVVVGVAGIPFPFLPRQLTLIGTFSIGVPGFFLALAPEVHRVRSGFLDRVLRFSIPAGVAAGSATLVAYQVARNAADLDLGQARTLATITLLAIGLCILVVASRPLRAWKVGLAAAMAGSYGLVMLTPALRHFFRLETLPLSAWWIIGPAAAAAGAVIALLPVMVPGLSGWSRPAADEAAS
jgi:cation-transporting ATPase E